MKHPSKTCIAFLIIILALFTGCAYEADKQQEYNKCTSVCAAVITDDFVTLELCRQECAKNFLEEDQS